jgi:hypothetical protein
MTHKTVRVSRGEVDIDEKLAPLMPLVWRCGIETVGCCQEAQPKYAGIEFGDAASAERFLSIADSKNCRLEWHSRLEGLRGDLVGRTLILVYFPLACVPELAKKFEAHLRNSDASGCQ